MTELVVDAYSEGWLRKHFPWVYPKEVVRGGAVPGDEVVIRSGNGVALGRGIADRGFLAARVFRHDEGPLDDAWLDGVLDRALALREAVVDANTTGYRLVHAENDGLPGVRIDWWSHFAVVVLDSPGLERFVPGLVRWLDDRRQPRGVVVCHRRDPRDPEGESRPPRLVAGHPPTGPVRISERGVQADVLPLDAPDVGLYADMRPLRAWLEPHWGGTRVLNLFAYTGMFSVVAALGGASEVVSVDVSRGALDRAEANFRANGLDPAAHTFLAEDALKVLDRLRRTGQRFDRVVFDPPAFSRGARTFSASADLPRWVAACARVLDPGGWLVVASNQGEISPRVFDGLVADGIRKASREAQVIYTGSQGPDFPAAVWFPEGRYLKVRVLRLVGS
jgi:23S rRNA (cytosine1962-C5)-methyltransferase